MRFVPCMAVVRILTVVALVPFVLVGRGAQSAPSQQSAAVVMIQGFAFEPPTLTVAVGTVVTWTNHDSLPHTATSQTAGKFDTGPIEKDQAKFVTLNEAGTFDYFCAIHPGMKGTITVTASIEQSRVYLPYIVS